MAFDIRERVKQRSKEQEKGQQNKKSQDKFDVREYSKQKRVGTVAEDISNRVNAWHAGYSALVNDSNSRYSAREDGKYVSDSSDWLQQTTTRKTLLDTEAESIRELMRQYDGYLNEDWVRQIDDALGSYGADLEKLAGIAQRDADYWAQFAPNEEQAAQGYTSESIYNQWYTDNSYRQKYAGQGYDQLTQALSAMADGEEKSWLEEYALSIATEDELAALRDTADNDEDYFKYQALVNQKQIQTAAQTLAKTQMAGTEGTVLDELLAVAQLEDGADKKARKQAVISAMREAGVDPDTYYSLIGGDANWTAGNLLNMIGSGFATRFVGAGKSVAELLDFTLGKAGRAIGWDNGIGDWAADMRHDYNAYAYNTDLYMNRMGGGTALETIKDVAGGVGGAVPQAILAMATAGTSTGLTLSENAAAATGNLLTKAGLTAEAMLKNPSYWMSFVQTYSSDYEEAKAKGADDVTAAFGATITSLVNAGIEIGIDGGSGIQGLPQNLAGGDKSAILEWVKSSLEEGGEEVLQGFVNNAVSKVLYDSSTKLVDPEEMVREFALGTAVGGILGGAQTAAVKGTAQAVGAVETAVNAARERTQTQATRQVPAQTAVEQVQAGNVTPMQQAVQESADTQNVVLTGSNETVQTAQKAMESTETAWDQRQTQTKKTAQKEQTAAVKDTKAINEESLQGQEYYDASNGGTAERKNTEKVAVPSAAADPMVSKAIVKSTGKTIVPQKITAIQDGKAILETQDGEYVEAADIEFPVKSYASLLEGVASIEHMDAPAANTIMRSFRADSNSPAEFFWGAAQAFRWGYYGYSRQDLTKSGTYAAKLTGFQRDLIHDAGIRVANESGLAAKRNQTERKKPIQHSPEEKKPAVRRKGVVKGYGVKVADIAKAFNTSQQQAYKILATIAEATGIDVVLFRSVPNKDGVLVGGVIDGIDFRDSQGAFSWHNDKIYIDINAGVRFETSMGDVQKYTMLRTFAHEFTHFIEKHNPEGYTVLRKMVFEEMSSRGENVNDLIEQKRNLGTDQELGFDEAAREVVADAMTDILQDSEFVEQLARKQPNVFKELLSKLKEFLNRIKEYFDSVTANGTREARLLKEATGDGIHYMESIVQAFDKAAVQAVENYQSGKTAQKNTVQEDAGVKYQIREIGNTGKFYVQADRQVLTGDDASLWGKQIENYINEQIRKEQDIAIPTADGHILLLTSRSAYKLKDNHVASIQKKVEAFLADDAYALKGRAATHIDELIQVARFKGYEPDMNQKHENDIGEDGFNYFEAYFRDLDGKYYLVRFSAALNAQEETVYSIGQIRQRSFPADAGSSSNTEALKKGKKASDSIIYTSEQKSQAEKNAIQLAYEKALQKKDSGNTDSGASQNQRRSEALTNRDVLAQAEQLVGEQFLTAKHRNALEVYNGQLAEVKKLEARKREQEHKLQKQQAEKAPAAETRKTKNRIDVFASSINREHEKLKRMENTQYLKEILTEAQTVLENRQIAESKAKLEEYRSKYGTIPSGEKAVRSDALPKSTDGTNKVSRTARTVKGAGVTPDDFADLIDVEVAGGGLSYLPITNSDTTQKAIGYITQEGWEVARYKWHADVRAGKANADMSAVGALLLNNAAKAGDRNAWLEILADYQIMGTRAAQAVQALRILKTLTPTDKLYMLQKSVEKMVKDLNLESDVTIDKALIDEYNAAETDKQRDAVITRIQREVALQLPSTGMEMWTALRYVNMLGNFKTQVRNVLGNIAMSGTNKLKNAVAASLEALVSKATGGQMKRTKSMTVSRELLQACRKDFAEVESLALDGGKYADAMTSRLEKGIRDQKTVFKAPASVKNQKARKAIDLALKPMEAYRRATNTLMEKGDLLFSRGAYARALAGYLKANGIKGTDLAAVDTELLDEARAYAVKEAQEVTFRDHNALTELLSSGRIGGGKLGAAASAAGRGIMPFRQTPANVLLRAEEYSPLGLINSLALTLEAAAGKTQLTKRKGFLGDIARAGQQVTGDQIINTFAKAFTGTGLFALGMVFANLGWAVGGPDDDEKKAKFDELNGRQNYALVFGDTSCTFDWLAPVAIPFFMGVNLQERIAEEGWSVEAIKGSLMSLTEPMLQMSMLQGLNDTLDELRYSDNSLLELVGNALTNYALQGMTNSLLSQLERSFEPNRQATYTDKNSEISADTQYTLGKISAKIPGWDYSQIPYINAWGEEEENLPLFANIPYSLLSPGYYSKDTTETVEKELYRLNEAQDENVFPSTPEKTFTYENVKHSLTAEEYVELAKTQGKTQRQIVEDMIGSALYKELPDQYKAKAIGFAYEYAKEYAQIEVLDRDGFSSDWMAEIQGDTAEGILAHVISQNIKGMFLAGDISASEAVERRVQYYGDSQEEAAEKVAYWNFREAHPEYADLSQSAVTKYYDYAKPANINMDVYYDFMTKKKACEGEDKNGDGKADSGTVKKEVLALIDSLRLTPEQKDALYYAEGWSESTIGETPWH